MNKRQVYNIVVIGASAGGLPVLTDVLATLGTKNKVSVFIVIHLSESVNPQYILQRLQERSTLPVVIAEEGMPIEHDKVYLAPADQHMMLERDRVLVRRGALENHWRPSIDVLFRTAAAAYDSCVTGIILSGLLDDGTSGMIAIKSAGGRCLVQEPDEAAYADMPRNVLSNIDVDYRVSAHEITYVLADIYSRGECSPQEVPKDLQQEAAITLRMSSNMESTTALGAPTLMTCPDCGGVLTKIEEHGHARYRCYTGHVFSEAQLNDQYLKRTEETLWVALRMMEERRNFIMSMDERPQFSPDTNGRRAQRVNELKEHITQLKSLLTALDN
ncbi:chemotaxis protein CheB [Sphingobacterium paludis]|uniref:protein-glutamate methylesterase n=1 Tax=Sphingobacterium paludis TaxID=1476465 RepID=A0A4R7CXD9_9SPHI|nr:chemotaxis protein CheB [Sphingobacterium paludis]TDS13193.1 two-component system chemotaxis response regulator CheB [Sphingobacterium paludis]